MRSQVSERQRIIKTAVSVLLVGGLLSNMAGASQAVAQDGSPWGKVAVLQTPPCFRELKWIKWSQMLYMGNSKCQGSKKYGN